MKKSETKITLFWFQEKIVNLENWCNVTLVCGASVRNFFPGANQRLYSHARRTDLEIFRDVHTIQNMTRKLCYRKDDRAMCPIHGCPENFRDDLTTPTSRLLFPTFFQVLLFRSNLWMFLQNLKSVALPVLEIIGGTRKIAHAPFSPKF